MYTDLFFALLDPDNPRGHPILAALLYAFCPAAARWWMSGAVPTPPFDPLWFSLTERATGKTLAEVLRGLGFETLLDDAKQYLEQVEAYRRHNANMTAPELLPTFPGGQVDVVKRFNHQASIEKLGGDWKHFFPFVHAWAFAYRDWTVTLHLTEAAFSPVRLALTLQGVRKPVYFPAWMWSVYGKEQPERISRLMVGLLGWEAERHDQLRMGLAQQAGLAGEQPWPVFPEMRVLQRNGAVSPPDIRLSPNQLPGLVKRFAELAKNGPYPPLPALQLSPKCKVCGFQAQCFTPSGELSPLTLGF